MVASPGANHASNNKPIHRLDVEQMTHTCDHGIMYGNPYKHACNCGIGVDHGPDELNNLLDNSKAGENNEE